jgi:hypothetical protein
MQFHAYLIVVFIRSLSLTCLDIKAIISVHIKNRTVDYNYDNPQIITNNKLSSIEMRTDGSIQTNTIATTHICFDSKL